MSSRPIDDDVPDHELEALERDLAPKLRALGDVGVDTRWRDELRGRFARGDIERAGSSGIEPSRSSDEDADARPARPWRRPLAWLTIAAAATIAAIAMLREPDVARLELFGDAPATIAIDGRARSLEPDALAAIERGARIDTADAPLSLRVAGRAVLELAPRSSLVLERMPAEARGGEIVLALASGALRVVTTEGFAPTRMRVRSPDAEVLVVGTEFGVDVFDGQGTCVCCTHGTVEVDPASPTCPTMRVGTRGMAWVPADGSKAHTGDAHLEHAVAIDALAERVD